MKNSDNEVIYVGKAKKLKNRVSSYFHGEHLPKVEAMIEKIDDFEIIMANSEFEALILENSLIKKYQPHYNILLKDDKGYPFVRIDMGELYPRFSIVSKPADDRAEYYGPFGGRNVTRDIIFSIEEALKLPTCNRKFPDCIGKDRPCLNYTLGLCDGWCIDEKHSEYLSRVEQARMILNGESKALVEDLTNKMYEASNEQKYEYAALMRDRIRNIDNLNNKQRVTSKQSSRYFKTVATEDNEQRNNRILKTLEELQSILSLNYFPERIESFDVSNLGDSGIVSAMTVFYNGKPAKKEYRKFRIKDIPAQDDYYSMYQTIIRRFNRYLENDPKFSSLPQILLIDGGYNHVQTVKAALYDIGLDIPVFGMVKDSRHRTRDLIDSNGKEYNIATNLQLFSLIGRIQEETHRFAVEYQRSVRYENYGSELDDIPGIGKKRKSDLLKKFKSVKAVKEASINELSEVLPLSTAKAVYYYFHEVNQ